MFFLPQKKQIYKKNIFGKKIPTLMKQKIFNCFGNCIKNAKIKRYLKNIIILEQDY